MKVTGDAKVEQLDALTGLRGLAALWVAAMHFSHESQLLLPVSVHLDWLVNRGGEAVPLFFILSGFILLHTYRAHFEVFSWREYFQFLWLRLARIYPTYLATLGLMVGLVAASMLAGVAYSKTAYPLGRLPAEALMLHRWWQSDFSGWNYPDWSISAEWFAYLFIFPLAVWLLKRLGGCRTFFIGLVAFGFLVLEPAVRTPWRISMVSLLFLAGACIWEVRRRLQSGKGLPAHLDVLAGGLFLGELCLAPHQNYFVAATGFLLVAGFLILGLSRTDGPVSRLLAWSPIFFLGEISYSFYLTHGIAQRVLKIILPAEKFAASSLPARLGVALAYVAWLFALSLCVYYLVERPARRWMRRRKVMASQTAIAQI